MSIIYDETSGKRKVSTKTVGSTTYGISIADLQSITGSSKRDLMLLHCESQNGVGTSSTDYSEDEYISKGDTKIRSAFRLGDMPIPTGWTKRTLGGRKGDLVVSSDGNRIAQPRWNLWADHINFGKFVVNVGTASSPKYEYRYNIFCPYNQHPLKGDGTPVSSTGMGAPNGEQWQNYSDHADEAHEPKFDIKGFVKNPDHNNALGLEFHNSMFALLKDGKLRLGSQDRLDSMCFYLEDRYVLAQALVKMGNLIDWDANYGGKAVNGSIRLADVTTNGYSFTGNKTLSVYGCEAVAELGNAQTTDPLPIAGGVLVEDEPLTHNSSDAIKAKYRDEDNPVDVVYRCEYGASLYNTVKENNVDGYSAGMGKFKLCIAGPDVSHRFANTIATDAVVNPKAIEFYSSFDESWQRQPQTTDAQKVKNRRFILGSYLSTPTDADDIAAKDARQYFNLKIGNKNYYAFWSANNDSAQLTTSQRYPLDRGVITTGAGDRYYGIGMQFCFIDADSGTSKSTIAGLKDTGVKIGAMVEMISCDNNGVPVYYRRLFKQMYSENYVSQGQSADEWLNPNHSIYLRPSHQSGIVANGQAGVVYASGSAVHLEDVVKSGENIGQYAYYLTFADAPLAPTYDEMGFPAEDYTYTQQGNELSTSCIHNSTLIISFFDMNNYGVIDVMPTFYGGVPRSGMSSADLLLTERNRRGPIARTYANRVAAYIGSNNTPSSDSDYYWIMWQRNAYQTGDTAVGIENLPYICPANHSLSNWHFDFCLYKDNNVSGKYVPSQKDATTFTIRMTGGKTKVRLTPSGSQYADTIDIALGNTSTSVNYMKTGTTTGGGTMFMSISKVTRSGVDYNGIYRNTLDCYRLNISGLAISNTDDIRIEVIAAKHCDA